MKRHYPAWVELHPFGETLPYSHNRITVDPAGRFPDRDPADNVWPRAAATPKIGGR